MKDISKIELSLKLFRNNRVGDMAVIKFANIMNQEEQYL